MAQLVEHIVHIDGVTGSSPVATTSRTLVNQGFFHFVRPQILKPDPNDTQSSRFRGQIADEGLHPVGALAAHGRRHVSVAVQGERCGVMPHVFLQGLDIIPRHDALDGADADLNVIGDVRTVQAADTIELCEGTGVVVGRVSQELPLCLFSQGFGIHQEQDASHSAELEQAIRCRDCGEGLARARRHLHQCFGPILSKGSIQVPDRGDLAATESGGVKRREMLHVIADGIRLRKPCLERFRPVKGEDGTGTVFHILIIREARQLAGCLISKADLVIRSHIAEGAVGIAAGLSFDHGDVFA